MKKRKLKLIRAGRITEEISDDFKTKYWLCNFFSNPESEYRNKSGMRLAMLYEIKDYPNKKDLPEFIEIEFTIIKKQKTGDEE